MGGIDVLKNSKGRPAVVWIAKSGVGGRFIFGFGHPSARSNALSLSLKMKIRHPHRAGLLTPANANI